MTFRLSGRRAVVGLATTVRIATGGAAIFSGRGLKHGGLAAVTSYRILKGGAQGTSTVQRRAAGRWAAVTITGTTPRAATVAALV